ncbi:hypothetical protein H8959_014763 [Pygathrix nigripes]
MTPCPSPTITTAEIGFQHQPYTLLEEDRRHFAPIDTTRSGNGQERALAAGGPDSKDGFEPRNHSSELRTPKVADSFRPSLPLSGQPLVGAHTPAPSPPPPPHPRRAVRSGISQEGGARRRHGRGRGREQQSPPPPWGGRGSRQLHVCKEINRDRGAKPPSSWGFSVRAACRLVACRVPAPNADSTAKAREFGNPAAREASGEAQGLFPVASPAPGCPSRKSSVAPAPRVHNNRGPTVPAPLRNAPTAPSKFAGRNKTLEAAAALVQRG